jgi:hypothetical protein
MLRQRDEREIGQSEAASRSPQPDRVEDAEQQLTPADLAVSATAGPAAVGRHGVLKCCGRFPLLESGAVWFAAISVITIISPNGRPRLGSYRRRSA